MLFGKKILIIGGSGSLGHSLTERYIKHNKIFIFSRGENTQWQMKQTFNNPNLTFFVGDIRDKERIETCIFQCKPEIIIIAAALKHIDICENNINECINTNIDGIRNVLNLITTHCMIKSMKFLETIVFISTDKACAPVNTYGMCKSISERIIIEKSQFLNTPKFVNVRYGNVLSSRGSIIPFFKNITTDSNANYFPVTDEKMTRYFMTLDQSVDLIEYAIQNSNTGDTIIPKNIKSYRIIDIAKFFSDKYKKPIKIVGIRPGEKLHETLVSYTESLRTEERDDYYIIKPSYLGKTHSVCFSHGEFNSLEIVSDIDDNIKKIII
jgi:UDP-N-acetylglucosamine 4,6-dehydratase